MRASENKQRHCELSQFMYNLIVTSNQITTGKIDRLTLLIGQRGRALNLLKAGTKKRQKSSKPKP